MIFIPELIDNVWLEQFDFPNVILFLAGILNTSDHDRHHASWRRGILDKLLTHAQFEIIYSKLAWDLGWPDLQQITSIEDPPQSILDTLCEKLDYYPKLEICTDARLPLNDQDTPWRQILQHPLFADFYQNICDSGSWKPHRKSFDKKYS
jgi:hypothetical protein